MADPKIQRYSYQWFIDQFVEAKDRSIDFCEPLSHDIFVRRPAEDSWCVGECYSHLNTFGHKYMEQIYKGIDQASREREPKSAQESYPPRLLWKGVIKFFAPPYKMKVKTVKPFYPETKANLKKELVLNDFVHLQDSFIDLLKDAQVASVDLGGTKVANPLVTFVKMRLSECFAVAEVHQRRHMWQAEQVLKQLQE